MRGPVLFLNKHALCPMNARTRLSDDDSLAFIMAILILAAIVLWLGHSPVLALGIVIGGFVESVMPLPPSQESGKSDSLGTGMLVQKQKIDSV